MPKTYEKGRPDQIKLLAEVMAEHHPELAELGVRVGLVNVLPACSEDGEPTGPAIKFAGAAVAAQVKLTTPAQRVHVDYDAIVSIDNARWNELSDESRAALLDHELTHLEVAKDKDGVAIITDDLRPKLKTRPDDFIVTGFYEVIKRHGDAALEYRSVYQIVTCEDGQRAWDFAGAAV